ncbi:MAG: hypothetical protein IKT56_00785 [Clostridia bacterium]|nr:hypothetical protein [Clostridia bacterium]
MQRKGKNRKGISFSVRLIFIAVIFTFASFFYITKLANIQLVNRSKYTSSVQRTYSRIVTIQAQRGEIFDRNGKALVTNVYTYNLNFDYGSLSKNVTESNSTILGVINSLEVTGNSDKRVESKFPLLGSYPNFIYDEKLLENQSERTKFERVLGDLGFDKNKDGEKIELTAEQFAIKLVEKYSLDAIDEEDNPLYTNEQITEIMRVRYDMVYNQFSSVQPYLFAKEVDLSLITLMKESSLRGYIFTEDVSRKYEYPGYASHILGTVGTIYKEDLEYYSQKGYKMNAIVGRDGCEEAFEEFLHGVDGTMVIEEDAYGNIISQRISKEPISGNDVWLTIDIDMQIAAEDGLKDNIEYIVDKAKKTEGKFDGEDAFAGAITAVGVSNGEIYAIASYPTFDLSDYDYNSLREDETAPLYNRALLGLYQPGSTFKVGVAAAALEEGIITPKSTIATKGRYTFYDANGPRCWLYLSKGQVHGTINVIEAIQESCNYFFYDVGRQLTISNINKYASLFGLGQTTGIELPESAGILAGPDYRDRAGLGEWYPGDTLQAAIGQSDNLFTPLQISSYIATLVGGGTRYSTHLLHSVRKFYTNEIVYEYEPKVLGNVELKDSTYKTLMTAMKSVTEYGSASRVFSTYPIPMGGKTGTAQVSTTKSDNAIFTAFAPFDNPEIVATCIIEQGNSGTDAGFTVKDVFDSYFGLDDK